MSSNNMDPKTIVIIVVVLIILYYFYYWVTTTSTTLSLLREGEGKAFKPNIEIPQDKLKKTGGSNNFTYSIWIYIDNWNHLHGYEKVIFQRGKGPTPTPSPKVSLGAFENNLTISLDVYAPSATTSTDESSMLSNIPLQKWVNVLYSVYGRTLDTYLDGKLVKTKVLKGTVKIDDEQPIILFPAGDGSTGGFGGKITTFKYWPTASNPQEAWDIYTSGYGSNIFGNLLDKYRLQVSFMSDGVATTSFQI
jgi:hypothetical protein